MKKALLLFTMMLCSLTPVQALDLISGAHYKIAVFGVWGSKSIRSTVSTRNLTTGNNTTIRD